MCEAFIGMLAAAVIVGVIAQIWKKRTGAFWAIATLALELPVYFVLYLATAWDDPGRYSPAKHPDLPSAPWLALALVVSAAVAGTMLLIVASLPRSKAPSA